MSSLYGNVERRVTAVFTFVDISLERDELGDAGGMSFGRRCVDWRSTVIPALGNIAIAIDQR
jgi:hypothetical protein